MNWLERAVQWLTGGSKQRRTINLQVLLGASMNPANMTVGQTLVATAVPLEADGVTPTAGAVVTNQSWSSSDTSVATVTANADGTATVKALAPGADRRISVSAIVTDSDGTVSTFSATNLVSVTPAPVPTNRTASLGISFGTPA